MSKKTRYSVASIVHMASANFSSWFSSTRTIVMLLFVIAFCYLVTCNHMSSIQHSGYQIAFVDSVFALLSNGGSITTNSILYLVTISELPRRNRFQYNLLIRTSRTEWLLSQILYCIWMVFFMLILITCSTIFFSLQFFPGDVKPQIDAFLIPDYLQNKVSPWIACVIATIPMFFFWVVMTLIILLFSLFNMPVVGLTLYAVMLVANVVFMIESFGNIPLPIYYATFSNIVTKNQGNELGAINHTIGGYIGAIIVLYIIMYSRLRCCDLCFSKE